MDKNFINRASQGFLTFFIKSFENDRPQRRIQTIDAFLFKQNTTVSLIFQLYNFIMFLDFIFHTMKRIM